MKITEVQTIPIRSLGKPASRGKGRVIVTPLTAFYDDLPVYPHGGRCYNYHLIMSHLNSPIAEYFPPPSGTPYVNEYLWLLWNGEPVAEDGAITLSDKPGLGVEINWNAVTQYRADLS